MTSRSFSFVILLSLVFAATAPAREILLRHSFANRMERTREREPLRSRLVEPDFEALRRSGKLTVALFDDVVLHVQLTALGVDAAGTSAWSGQIEGEAGSSVVLSVRDGAMSALFWTPSRRFSIEPGPDGSHEVLELGPLEFPDERAPVRPPLDEEKRTAAADTLSQREQETTTAGSPFFDALVVYTDDLRLFLGGTAAVQTAITNAVVATNMAYANSGVTARIRLVGTAEVAYEESGEMETALHALRDRSDGSMDEVHALRDRLGADVVSLFVLNGGGGCGVSYIMSGSPRSGFASSAFSVVRNHCATASFSFAHELGHNFGLEHDRQASPSGSPAYSYGFGYVDTERRFRDIMAYSSGCDSCPRVPYFSNPELRHLGRPLGVSHLLSNSADNVRAINKAAAVIAGWRRDVRIRRRAVR